VLVLRIVESWDGREGGYSLGGERWDGKEGGETEEESVGRWVGI
jgi:hypothetical protein